MLIRILTALLVAVLGVGVMLPPVTVSASSHNLQTISIRTFVGSPNPHARGPDCVGCHWPEPPRTKDTRNPQEPCAECHVPATRQEIAIARSCNAPICPVILNYVDMGKSFFMGYFRR